MKNEFVPYDIALALKELGFDEVCFVFYLDSEHLGRVGEYESINSMGEYLAATLYQQAFRWFREKGYHCGIIPRYDEFHYFIKDFVNDKEYDDVYNISSYEEAELACLRKLIEIIKNKEDEQRRNI